MLLCMHTSRHAACACTGIRLSQSSPAEDSMHVCCLLSLQGMNLPSNCTCVASCCRPSGRGSCTESASMQAGFASAGAAAKAAATPAAAGVPAAVHAPDRAATASRCPTASQPRPCAAGALAAAAVTAAAAAGAIAAVRAGAGTVGTAAAASQHAGEQAVAAQHYVCYVSAFIKR